MNSNPAVDHLLLADNLTAQAILPATETSAQTASTARMDWRQVIGAALVAGGIFAVIAGWLGVSGTGNFGDQISYLASGGVFGAAMIALGVMFMVIHEHRQDRVALADLSERMVALEDELSEQLRQIHKRLGSK